MIDNYDRRLRVVKVTIYAIQDFLFCEGRHEYKLENGLPMDAKFVEARVDAPREIIEIVFRHPTFDVVPDGQPIPEHNSTRTYSCRTF